jgi:hypothetical protein
MGPFGAKISPPFSSLTPPPPLPPQLSNVGGGVGGLLTSPPGPGPANTGPTSLEMLLVERAKAIQQANPALKAFADMQGKSVDGKP